jgi:hypothetical protein
MTRLYGRAPKGARITERVPRNYGAHTSLISSLSIGGVEATMSIEGAVYTKVFDAYVRAGAATCHQGGSRASA